MNEPLKKDLTGALRALESNNALPPEEKQKRTDYAQEKGQDVSKSLLRPLRTFEADLAHYMTKHNTSTFNIKQAERTRNPQKTIEIRTQTTDDLTRAFSFMTMIALFVGLLALVGYLLFFHTTPTTTQEPLIHPSLVSFDTEQTIQYDPNQKNLKTVLATVPTTQKENSVTRVMIYIGTTQLTTEELLAGLNSSINPATAGLLIRNIDQHYYTLGKIHKDGTDEPFIIIPVISYDNTFAGILSIESNLHALFTNIPPGHSSTSIESYRDIIVEQQDARVLKDIDGNDIVAYSIVNKKTLILTTDRGVLAQLIKTLK